VLDEGRAAHDWIKRIAYLVGVVAAIVGAGYYVGVRTENLATKEDLDAFEVQQSGAVQGVAEASVEHAGRIQSLEDEREYVKSRLDEVERKLDWLIRLEVATARRAHRERRALLRDPPEPSAPD